MKTFSGSFEHSKAIARLNQRLALNVIEHSIEMQECALSGMFVGFKITLLNDDDKFYKLNNIFNRRL